MSAEQALSQIRQIIAAVNRRPEGFIAVRQADGSFRLEPRT